MKKIVISIVFLMNTGASSTLDSLDTQIQDTKNKLEYLEDQKAKLVIIQHKINRDKYLLGRIHKIKSKQEARLRENAATRNKIIKDFNNYQGGL